MTAVNEENMCDDGRTIIGAIKWFDEVLEYGFIQHPDVENDIFVHRKSLTAGTREHWLTKGRAVSFVLKLGNDSPKKAGPRALRVSVVEGEDK